MDILFKKILEALRVQILKLRGKKPFQFLLPFQSLLDQHKKIATITKENFANEKEKIKQIVRDYESALQNIQYSFSTLGNFLERLGVEELDLQIRANTNKLIKKIETLTEIEPR